MGRCRYSMNYDAYPVKWAVVPSSVPANLDSLCLRSHQRASPAWLRKWSIGDLDKAW